MVSLSNHELAFDRLRPNGIGDPYSDNVKAPNAIIHAANPRIGYIGYIGYNGKPEHPKTHAVLALRILRSIAITLAHRPS